MGRFYSNPVARIQKLDNVSAVMKFLDRNFHIEPPCSAEDVVDGDVPAIMDLMEELVQGFDPDMEGPLDQGRGRRRPSYSDSGSSRSRSRSPPPGYIHGGPVAPPMVPMMGAPMMGAPMMPDVNSQMAMLQTMQSIQAMQAVQSQQSMMTMMMSGGMSGAMPGMGMGMPGVGALPPAAVDQQSASPEPEPEQFSEEEQEQPKRVQRRARSRSVSSRGSTGAVRKKRSSSKSAPTKEARGRTKERTAPTTPRKRSSSRGAPKKKKETFDPSITGLAGGAKKNEDGVVGDFDGGATLGGDFAGTSNTAPKKRSKKK